jgi:hypothetical protein
MRILLLFLFQLVISNLMPQNSLGIRIGIFFAKHQYDIQGDENSNDVIGTEIGPTQVCLFLKSSIFNQN